MSRLDRRFALCRAEKRAALVTFVMAGDPDIATAREVLKALPKAGADIIEIGMPFTDPMADGPAIQAAGLRALRAKTTLQDVLGLVRDVRASDADTPLILMGYYNPIYSFGVDAFLKDAKEAGVDGLIVVDLPAEEDEELCQPALAAGLAFIRLATPTTDDARLAHILQNTSGFPLLRVDDRHDGRCACERFAGRRSRCAAASTNETSDRCGLRREVCGGRARYRRACRCRRRRFRNRRHLGRFGRGRPSRCSRRVCRRSCGGRTQSRPARGMRMFA